MTKQIRIPDVDKLYSCGVLMVDGDITGGLINTLAKEAIALHIEDSSAPVSVVINSTGGDLYSAWQLIEILLGIGAHRPVTTYCLGEALSAGAMIYLAGTIRIATPRSRFMLHQYSWGGPGKFHELQASRDMEDWMYIAMCDYIKDRAGESAAELLNNKSDVWLTPKQAKKHGIVHKVVNRVNIPRRIGAVLNGGKDA